MKRKAAKCILALVMAAALLFAAWALLPRLRYRLSPKRPVYVLTYHNVAEDGQPCNEMTVTAGKLREDLEWLRAHGYETILPHELAAGKKLPRRFVLLTFDDGYRSNYELLFPLLRETGMKAAISLLTCMAEEGDPRFLTWEMCREMAASGLVEIGSHTHALHNLATKGLVVPGGVNGIQRDPAETDGDFRRRVLDDLQKSYDLIAREVAAPTFLAFPFGLTEPDAAELVGRLYPVTFVTEDSVSEVRGYYQGLARLTVTMDRSLEELLPQ